MARIRVVESIRRVPAWNDRRVALSTHTRANAFMDDPPFRHPDHDRSVVVVDVGLAIRCAQ